MSQAENQRSDNARKTEQPALQSDRKRPVRMISTRGDSPPVSFTGAMKAGLAPDGGLYVPDPVPRFSAMFLEKLSQLSIRDAGREVMKHYGSDDGESERLVSVVEEAINFDAPLVPLREGIFLLELFHGPTLAFKDFGARYMARAFAAADNGEDDRDLLILVATSGDTGSAVAHGFYGVPGTRVCLLYPSGKVSRLQEQQMTTLGGNVTALEVDGTFDDCQRLVKEAFSDSVLRRELRLSSANSINIARLIPQSFYYIHAVAQLQQIAGREVRPFFSVPSGNFGNLTAGLIAMRMGMPAAGFLAATNVNDVVPRYLETGIFEPRASTPTLSNAMDVGHPSNFERILYLFGDSHSEIRKVIDGCSFDDKATRETIGRVWKEYGYRIDPHTAVGLLAAERRLREAGGEAPLVILSTAHPAKFSEVVEAETGRPVPLPEQLRSCLEKPKQTIPMGSDYAAFRSLLAELP